MNSKRTYSSNKSKSSTLKALNKATCLDTSTFPAIGGTIDYNIVEDMKKMQAKISIYEVAMIIV